MEVYEKTYNKKAYDKEWYQKNKDIKKSYCKEWYQKNKDKALAYRKEQYQKNKDEALAYSKEYYQKNKDMKKAYRKEQYQKNKDEALAYSKEYYQKNKDKINARVRERIQADPLYKISCACRERIRKYYKSKGLKKSKHTFEMLGCTVEELRDHLQSQFTDGMTFENHGEWHIDHIIPLASAKTEEEIIKLCHYTNLQPLWSEDNWSKGTKLTLIEIDMRGH